MEPRGEAQYQGSGMTGITLPVAPSGYHHEPHIGQHNPHFFQGMRPAIVEFQNNGQKSREAELN